MSTVEFLSYLRSLDVEVWLEQGTLRYSAPKDVLTGDLRRQLTDRKAGLIQFLRLSESAAKPSSLQVVRASRKQELPLSFAQQRLWFLDQFEPANSAYNVYEAFRIQGPLDIQILEACFSEVQRRHEALRTTFTTVEGRPAQVIAPPVPHKIRFVDLRSLPGEERQSKALQLLTEEAQRPFQLEQGPLFRTYLLQLDNQEHDLMINMHHIGSDGWSLGVLNSELSQLYSAYCRGSSSPLNELQIQYADFANSQREWLQGEVLEKELSYWKQKLAGNLPALELPTDRPRPSIRRYFGVRESVTLPTSLRDRLKEFSRERGVTLFMTLLAAYKTLLYRYTGQEDVLLGSPIANRNIPEVESLIGFFVNMLVLRTDLSGDPTFDELINRVRDVALGAYAHQDFPFDKLVETLQPERSLSHTPLFPVVFVLQNTSNNQLSLAGLSVTALDIDYGRAMFDSILQVTETDDGLVVRIEYNTDLFEPSTIKRTLNHYQMILNGIVSNPAQHLSELPLLTNEETVQLIRWNSLREEFPIDACLHEKFEAQVSRTPDAIAAVFENDPLTYSQLNRRANQVARRLRKNGVGPDVLAGICMDRSLELVVGILAILKAGGAYLPLQPSYPKERMAFMLADARSPLLLTQSHLIPSLPDERPTAICLDTDWSEISTESEENLTSAVKPHHLAYVIYTSGSTGKPKGVLITHANVMRLFAATDNWFHFDSKDVWTLFHSYAFDFSVWELWGALLYGGRLVVVPFLVSRSPEDFYALLCEEKVTVLNQTPSAFRQLIKAEQGLGRNEDLQLRFIIFGGEALEIRSLKPWFEQHGDERPQLVNMYGITETTVHVTYRPIGLPDLEGSSPSVIGAPIPDLQIYIFDPHGNRVPVGVPGELYVSGAGLARGYLNRPELTEQRFIRHPFTKEGGSRLYRTGDLARYLNDGDIEYLGRLDQQVKIRGFRIELEEIENVLGSHPEIAENVVLVKEGHPGDKRLVAYVVAKKNGTLSSGDLNKFCKTKLPDYMVPSAFVFLEKFSLTSNGKLDRAGLPDPDLQRPDLEERYVAPRTEPEQILSGIWAQLLRLQKIGINDNFFELGGDSILSIQMIARARQAGLQLSPKLLFQHQTIAELAAAIPSAKRPTVQDSPEGSALLTPIQHWFFEQNLPDIHYWNQTFVFQILSRIDLTTLEKAADVVLSHHDAFRLRFSREHSNWKQQYSLSRTPASVTWFDLSSVAEPLRTSAITKTAVQLQQTLNVQDGPLWRMAYLDLAPEIPGRLIVAIHHLLIDGVSWQIFMEDLEHAYQQLSSGSEVKLLHRTTSYKYWGERLQELAQSSKTIEELPYWIQVQSDRDDGLPVDFENGQNTEESAETITTYLSDEESAFLLQKLPAIYKTQINEILLAALAETLGHFSSSSSIVIDLEGHGREDIFEDVDLSRTIGWFTTIYPLRLPLNSHNNVWEILKTVKQELRNVRQHGFAHGLLRYLQNDSEIRRKLSNAPSSELIFNYLGQLDQMLARSALFQFAPESSGPWHGPKGKRTHLLEIMAMVLNGKLQIQWHYSIHVHKKQTIFKLAHQLIGALRKLIAESENRDSRAYVPSDFPLATLDAAALDHLSGKQPVEDLYPLSPMQQLFYTMEGSAPEVTFEQWQYVIRGDLNVPAFIRAWEHVIQRHSILRTAFLSTRAQEAFQIVYPKAKLSSESKDWRGLSPDEQEKRLQEFLIQDRQTGFDLSKPPLTRITIVQIANHTFRFIWSTHHLQIDGWSWPIILREISILYKAFTENEPVKLEPSQPFKDYIQWLKNYDFRSSERFWQTALKGFQAPTPLPLQTSITSKHLSFGEQETLIPEKLTSEMNAFSRKHQITLSTLLQAAWALLLSHHSGKQDVVFGVTFSGRPADLPGVETIVGPFINNLPVRVKIDPEREFMDWLQHIQDHHFQTIQYQHTSLLQIQDWSEVPWRWRLFESLLVFQNYAVDPAAARLGMDIEMRTISAPDKTSYPLTILAVPGKEVFLKIIYHLQRFNAEAIHQLLSDFIRVLDLVCSPPMKFVSEILNELNLSVPVKSEQLQEASKIRPEHAPPRTEIEKRIVDIWQEVFGIEKVGLYDNFFDLGGQSIVMIQIHKRLREVINAEMPITKMFQYPTISSLAQYLSDEAKEQRGYDAIQDRARKQKESLLRQQKNMRRR